MRTPWTPDEAGAEARLTGDELRERINGARSARQPPRLEAVPGDATTIRRTRWAWQGWAPVGSFLVIAGEPATGKGVATCYLLANLTQGTARGPRGPAGECALGGVRGQLAGDDPAADGRRRR